MGAHGSLAKSWTCGVLLWPTYALAATYFLMSTCSAMTSLAISLHFSALGDGEGLVAGILVSGACAQVFVAPFLAPFFDRFSASRVAQTAVGIEVLALVTLWITPTPPILIGGNLIIASLSGLSIPAIFVIAEECSPSHHQAQTFSLLDTARLCGSFLGPLLGGLLLDAGTLRMALAAEIGAVMTSLVVIIAVQRFVPIRIPVDQQSQIKQSFFQRLAEAPSLLLRHQATREALTSIWAAIIFTSIYNVALVFYATQRLHVSGLMFAVISQAFIVGRIMGARFASHLSEQNALTVLMRSGVVMGICIALPGLFPSLWLCIPMFLLAGVCNALQVAALRMVVVATVPSEIKPKALSTMGTVNNSAMLLGYVIGAPIVASIGPALALVISGLGTALLTLLPRSLRRLRKV